MSAGRSCPLSYRYSPSVLRAAASIHVDTLYVVGGLYGNQAALDMILAMFEQERGNKHLIFNGDFNWFDVDPQSFSRINQAVLTFDAIRGNVETELARPNADGAAAGCGCAYPAWVDDTVVEDADQIMQRLARTALQFPLLWERLAALPMWQRIDVGGLPVGIVHGDAESLAGWGFAPEHLQDRAYRQQAQQWFDAAGVRIFACSHTCSPILCRVSNVRGQPCLIANNGAAGMPNFSGLQEGLLTRIATTAYNGPVCYGDQIDGLYVEALPIRYDVARWRADFLRQWPTGSAAHASYWSRISCGPSYRIENACMFSNDLQSARAKP